MKIERRLMTEVLDTLARLACAFWACDGPNKRPRDMITCARCRALRKVRKVMAKK